MKTITCVTWLLFISFSNIYAKESKDSNSYFIVSAIKSIPSLGEVPQSEYLDIFVKFHYAKTLFSYGNVDLAFSQVTKDKENAADSIKTTQNKLTDAGIYMALAPFPGLPDTRELFVSVGAKIFNTVPYYGFNVGSMEMGGALRSSYCTIGVMWRWLQTDSLLTQQLNVKSFNSNIYVEFAIHSPEFDVLKFIRARVGVLIPLPDHAETRDIQTRISLEVPIGSIQKFM